MGDNIAHFLGVEPFILEAYIASILDGGNNSGVGRGSANAAFFQLFHQAGLAKSRGGFGEMLRRLQFSQFKFVALLNVRHHHVITLTGRGDLNCGVTIKTDNPAAGGELIFASRDGYQGRGVFCRCHLTGDELAPNQLIQPSRITGGLGSQIRQRILRHINVRWPDGLVSFLGTVLG